MHKYRLEPRHILPSILDSHLPLPLNAIGRPTVFIFCAKPVGWPDSAFRPEKSFDQATSETILRKMFTFETLDHNLDSIRLLILLPHQGKEATGKSTDMTDDDADEICCELEHRTLASKPSYEALSYTWGEKPASNTLRINGQPFFIRENLYNALRNFRLPTQRALWVDAICINQADIQERNYQVSLMSYIYARAQQVLVWLGHPPEPLIQKERENAGFRNHWSEADRIAIADHPYWSRRWVIQELVLAKDVKFHLGVRYFTWDEYTNMMGGVRYEILRRRLDLIRDHQKQRHTDVHRLEVLLETFQEAQCAEKRDKIFGLLGLANDCVSDMIEVDYTIGYFDLYTKLIELHQTSKPLQPGFDQGLAALMFSCWTATPFRHRLKLTREVDRSARLIIFSQLVQKTLGGAVEEDVRTATDSKAPRRFYVARGVFAGEIIYLGPTYSQIASSWKANKIWKKALEEHYKDEPGLVDLRKADAEYSCGILNWDQKYLESIRKVDTMTSYGYQQSADDEFLITDDHARTCESSEPRRFLGTQSLIGFVPPEARLGDLVCSFWECNVGVVVRKVGEDRWMIVGRADLSTEKSMGIIREQTYSEAMNYNLEESKSVERETEWSRKRREEAFKNMINLRLDIEVLQKLTS